MISVFLIAASPRRRRDLESHLDPSEVEIVGQATDPEMAAEELADKEADVILMILGSQPSEEWIDSLEESRLARETPVVLIGEQSSANLVQRAVRAGVKGILAAGIEMESLSHALAAVAGGLLVLSPEEPGLLQTIAGTAAEVVETTELLTPRENEVLQKIASGLANKEIATRMKISEHTVKFHVASILGKLGAASRTEAVSIGMRRGLILL